MKNKIQKKIKKLLKQAAPYLEKATALFSRAKAFAAKALKAVRNLAAVAFTSSLLVLIFINLAIPVSRYLDEVDARSKTYVIVPLAQVGPMLLPLGQIMATNVDVQGETVCYKAIEKEIRECIKLGAFHVFELDMQ